MDGSVSVVSNAFGEARSDVAARRAKRPRPSEARADASDECIEKPSRRRAGAETKRNVGDETRCRAAAVDAFARAAASALDAPSADADVNPLLRRRARDQTGDLSANNPLRGLF